MTSKKFCLITPGRAASTALMSVLEGYDDIAVPNKNIDCKNNELIQQKVVKLHRRLYGELCGKEIRTNTDLIEIFFEYNQASPFAGFKTMPMRHKKQPEFLQRQDIQFITLTRDDIPSTVASFIAARLKNTWDRKGGAARSKIHIRGISVLMVWGNIIYIRRSLNAINTIKNGIKITYEALCDPDFSNEELNSYFGRTIQLANPVNPTSGADYIENWDWFKGFVERWSGTK
jgi:hypothetical protein